MAKEKLPSFTTPRGVFVYPKLTKPDFGTNDYPKPDGEYNVKVMMTKKTAAPLLKLLSPLQKEAEKDGQAEYDKLKKATRKSNPFKVHPLCVPEYDEDENETDNVIFNFKMKASGKSKKDGSTWHRKPVIFDAKGVVMKKVPNIWGGTEGKVNFDVQSFFTLAAGAGLSKYLTAAQIIDLVEDGNKSADAYGFGVEDGYEYDEAGFVDANEEAGDDAEAGEDAGDEEDF